MTMNKDALKQAIIEHCLGERRSLFYTIYHETQSLHLAHIIADGERGLSYIDADDVHSPIERPFPWMCIGCRQLVGKANDRFDCSGTLTGDEVLKIIDEMP